ncbi:MAG: PKD domain-containing protein [Bacteroidales bacterium]|nr:PKD domain-containing protein [Bacteroidales bacterium]
MKGNKLNIEQFVKNQLDNHEYSYDAGEWGKLEKKLSGSKSSFFNNPLSYISAAIIVLGVILTLNYTNSFETEKPVKSQKVIEQNLLENITLPKKEVAEILIEKPTEKIGESPINENHTNNNDSSEDRNFIQEEKKETVEKFKLFAEDQKECIKDIDNKTNEAKEPCALFEINVLEGCVPLEIVLTPYEKSDSMVYLWDFGNGSVSNKISGRYKYNEAGNYNVSLTVKYFKSEKVVTYRYNQPVVVNAGPKIDFDYEINNTTAKFTVLSELNLDYLWKFGDGSTSDQLNPEHIYSRSGNFKVELEAKAQNSCKSEFSKTVKIEKEKDYIMPEAFKPDGDGFNDFFGPVFRTTDLVYYEMQIFNQHGLLVFTTKDIDKPWDGRILGRNDICDQGVYVFVIKTTDKYGNSLTEKGHFSLLK